jgi:peptidoglycan/xylan/chitin deacetylase (PgdA/CDA1 family)
MYKSRLRRSTYRRYVVISLVLIIALSIFSVLEYLKVDSLSKELAQEQQQNSSLSSDLSALQSQNQTLQDQYNALQQNIDASKTASEDGGSDTSGQGNGDQGKVAYLTFDDGPSSLTPHLLDVLRENDVKATFFIAFMSEDSADKRAWIKQIADAGHTVGVHSWSHDYDKIYANEDNFLEDFNKMKDVIKDATGIDPKVSRFPGGIGNSVSITASGGEEIMPELVEDVENMGIKPFDWNAGGEDASTPYPTTEELVQAVLNDAKGHDTVIILLHSERHQFSIDAVPEIVKQLRNQGYTFKTLTPDSPAVQQSFAKKNNG